MLLDLELHGRRDVGQHFAVGVLGRGRIVGNDYHGVGHHVLRALRVQPDLLHHAFEDLAAISVDGKRDGKSGVDAANVGLVDLGPDLHPSQVFGEQEQARGAHRANDGLPDADPPRNDHALAGARMVQ